MDKGPLLISYTNFAHGNPTDAFRLNHTSEEGGTAASEDAPEPDLMYLIFHSRPIMNCELCIMHWSGFPHGGQRRTNIGPHRAGTPSSRKEHNDILPQR